MTDWVEILFTYDEMEAQIVKDVLESADIQVVVNSMKIMPYPVSIGRMGEVRLLVRREDVEKAERILKATKDTAATENGDNDS
ncbi:MAG: DUF2007 domain-containing protein [Deferribacteres bacterium]|nr:DUF2007 domain-containing protein [Deferribacteres bacterium]